jgi:succinate dehydrogenase/fumarate reductase flavoprotein subunit
MRRRHYHRGRMLAGIMGAKAACGRGAKVLLLTHRTVGLATNSAISNGVFAGPTASYAADAYIQDTFLIGKKLNSLPHIEAVARGIGPAMSFLRSAGCHITETHGYYLVQPARPDVIPGVTLMKTLAANVKGSQGTHGPGGILCHGYFIPRRPRVGRQGNRQAGER